MLMKDYGSSYYIVDLNLYKQESYHCNLQLAPYYWIAILKSMPVLIEVIQILMWLAIWNSIWNPKLHVIVVLPFTALRAQNCMFKVVYISPAFVKHVVLIDNILYVTWKGITWINTLAGVSWPATSQAVVQLWLYST